MDFDIFEIVTIEWTYNMSVANTHRKILTVTNIQIYVTLNKWWQNDDGDWSKASDNIDVGDQSLICK